MNQYSDHQYGGYSASIGWAQTTVASRHDFTQETVWFGGFPLHRNYVWEIKKCVGIPL